MSIFFIILIGVVILLMVMILLVSGTVMSISLIYFLFIASEIFNDLVQGGRDFYLISDLFALLFTFLASSLVVILTYRGGRWLLKTFLRLEEEYALKESIDNKEV
jgi:predicted membrane protein